MYIKLAFSSDMQLNFIENKTLLKYYYYMNIYSIKTILQLNIKSTRINVNTYKVFGILYATYFHQPFAFYIKHSLKK